MPENSGSHPKSFNRKIIFYAAFSITLFSTLLVFIACVLTSQSMLNSVFYMLFTMWLMGILSLLLMQNLYFAVVQPLEIKREEELTRELWEYEPESIEEANRLEIKGKK
ncbi:MAG: hypothetical protein K0S07_97 [Chlamydiales bacterium]|jgi:hypothetical protein|nr:hypothetical protein [Chlamydiales bacterium]